ncbi:MAG: GTP 3',8-cyclase MoaA [Gammaproteobacteria bacterium]|nr:MAG: GTP 3',8-cyclase MoaA [Gammaproteobacteria bacterium]
MTVSKEIAKTNVLIDRFGRRVDYVRLSVTDRCDFRCVYCMSENMTFLPRAQLLTLEEMALLSRAFVELGVSKIRITGGEPLMRKGVLGLFQQIGKLPGLRELVMTTNGSQLEKTAKALKSAGLKRLNVSLDTLNAERFERITRVGDLDQVLRGIDSAKKAGFEKIKINAVILKNRNFDEVGSLVSFAAEKGLDISFIEEMPLGVMGDHDRAETYVSSDEIKVELEKQFTLNETEETSGGPARYYGLQGSETKVGFISPHSHNFCGDCNRVRVTAEGRLLLCLGHEHSVDLRRVIRANPGDLEKLKETLIQAMEIKPERHEFNTDGQPVVFRHMSATGG